jgi:hypothetical protein
MATRAGVHRTTLPPYLAPPPHNITPSTPSMLPIPMNLPRYTAPAAVRASTAVPRPYLHGSRSLGSLDTFRCRPAPLKGYASRDPAFEELLQTPSTSAARLLPMKRPHAPPQRVTPSSSAFPFFLTSSEAELWTSGQMAVKHRVPHLPTPAHQPAGRSEAATPASLFRHAGRVEGARPDRANLAREVSSLGYLGWVGRYL